MRLISISPTLPKSDAPEFTPDNVARFFKQGKDNVSAGNWDAAGAMFRKALESGLKKKFPDIKGTPRQRIDKAAKQHKLTPELAEWAHQIRDLGNDAVHEEEFTEEEAKAMAAFTDLLLQYIFTMPGRLQAERMKAGEQKV